MSAEQAGPGWYPDPADEGMLRYWDGAQWTEYTDQNWAAKAQEQGVLSAASTPPTTSAGAVTAGPPTNGLAIASLVLGILNFACFPFFWVVGLPLGISARRQISEGRGTGDGLALAGVIINGIIGALVVVGILIFVLIVAANAGG